MPTRTNRFPHSSATSPPPPPRSYQAPGALVRGPSRERLRRIVPPMPSGVRNRIVIRRPTIFPSPGPPPFGPPGPPRLRVARRIRCRLARYFRPSSHAPDRSGPQRCPPRTAVRAAVQSRPGRSISTCTKRFQGPAEVQRLKGLGANRDRIGTSGRPKWPTMLKSWPSPEGNRFCGESTTRLGRAPPDSTGFNRTTVSPASSTRATRSADLDGNVVLRGWTTILGPDPPSGSVTGRAERGRPSSRLPAAGGPRPSNDP